MPVSRTDVLEARERVRHKIHYTPVFTSSWLDEQIGGRIYFKAENLQKAGAFKSRGATNAVAKLSSEASLRGVATHSSGNHAQALARVAAVAGIPAFVVMPGNAPKVKVAAVQEYGAQITFCEPTLVARETTLRQVIERTGATEIHPYNNLDVIEGQATCGSELIEQMPVKADYLLCPVGGGGLLSGTILAARYFSPETKVIAGEPQGADDAYRSWKQGQLVPSVNPKTIADGLLTSLGSLTYPIIRDGVHDIITVSEESIVAAMRILWERMKLVVEPSSAVPLAVILDNAALFKNQTTGVILSGGNVDLNALPF